MIGTFGWYIVASFRNRLLHRLRRLKQPRYLISALLGIAYFGFLAFRRAGHVVTWNGRGSDVPPDAMILVPAAFLAVIMILAWALPRSQAGLELSEAEVQFLFPAPVSREQLLQFIILRAQIPLLITTLVLKAVAMRQGNVFGLWVTMAALQVYFLMVKLARARLRVAGIGFVARAIAVTTIIGLLGGFVASQYKGLTILSGSGTASMTAAQVLERAAEPMQHAPMSIVFFVPTLLAKSAFASGWGAVGLAILPIAAFVLVCGTIAVRLDVSYEDATVERARERAGERGRRLSAGSMRRVVTKRTPPPFKLAETGPPEVAIVWKNLIAAGRTSLPIMAIPLGFTAVVALFAFFNSGVEAALMSGSATLFAFAAFVVVLGPLVLRNDLRLDFERLDVLRAYPISGTRMVAAQVGAATLLTFALSAGAFILGCALYFPVHGSEWTILAQWGPLAVVFALPVTAMQLLIHNGLLVLLPGWATMSREESRGIESTGRGLMLLASQLVILAIAVIPSSILFAGGYWLSGFTLTSIAARAWVGAAPALALLVWEIALAIEFLGAQFERIDISDDMRVTEG